MLLWIHLQVFKADLFPGESADKSALFFFSSRSAHYKLYKSC